LIARLRGRVDGVDEDTAVIDVGGVGYEVHCSVRTLANLAVGAPADLHVETHMREDRIVLYGFAERAEREWFRLLQHVQGVGARMALALLGALPPAGLAQAISAGDATALKRAPGVGPRVAQRLISELRDKVGAMPMPAGIRLPGAAAAAARPAGPAGEAVSALVNLGYRPAEATVAVEAAARALGAGADLAALIRGGLRELGR